MDINDNGKCGTRDSSVPVDKSSEAAGTASLGPSQSVDEDRSVRNETPPAIRFATRGERKDPDDMSKTKLALLAGGLLVAVLFFVFTAVAGKAPKKLAGHIQSSNHAKAVNVPPQQPHGNVIPIMNTVRTTAADNMSGQVTPAEIRHTQSSDDGVESGSSSDSERALAKPAAGASLASVPPFSATQQKWEDPQPYEQASGPKPEVQNQNNMKETSIVFVRSLVQNRSLPPLRAKLVHDGAPLLDLPPGTRIEAKLETQISSAVQAPVVAVVEYTYEIGDKVVVPAGARVYGQLAQADPVLPCL
jgi:type IV secretory pathway VirB10-like protein